MSEHAENVVTTMLLQPLLQQNALLTAGLLQG